MCHEVFVFILSDPLCSSVVQIWQFTPADLLDFPGDEIKSFVVVVV